MVLMAVRDRAARIEAVQFHPESIGTAGGMQMLHNALVDVGLDVPAPRARPGNVPAPDAQGPRHAEARYGPA